MKAKLVLGILITGILVIGLTVAMDRGRAQIRDISQSGDVTPTVDLNGNKPLSSKEKEIRNQRGRKYRSSAPIEKMEDQDTVLKLPDPHSPVEPAFPVEQSDLVILGTVNDSQAFISNDRSDVYAEFRVRVDKIFKINNVLKIKSAENIVAERSGGKVRFDSGKLQRRGELGRGLPQKSRQYILFLNWDAPGNDCIIITGYEVQGQIIHPLDGLPESNPNIYKNYKRYRNAVLNNFLCELEEAITKSTRGIALDQLLRAKDLRPKAIKQLTGFAIAWEYIK